MSAMTATRLGPARAPEATALSLEQPVGSRQVPVSRACAAFRARWSGSGLGHRRLGAVRRHRSVSVGAGRRRLLAGAGTHACGHRLLNRRRRTTRISQGALARRRFVDLRTAGRACPAVCRTLVGQNTEARGVHRFIGLHCRPSVARKQHRDRPFHRALVDGIASALPRRTTAWKALEGSARHFDGTGRDRCAEECVRLPDHQRSSRVVLLVDCSRRRLADRSRVAVCSLAPWRSSAAEADRRVRHCDGDHDRRQFPLCHTVRTIPLPASRL